MIFGKPPDHLIKVATLIKDFWRLWGAWLSHWGGSILVTIARIRRLLTGCSELPAGTAEPWETGPGREVEAEARSAARAFFLGRPLALGSAFFASSFLFLFSSFLSAAFCCSTALIVSCLRRRSPSSMLGWCKASSTVARASDKSFCTSQDNSVFTVARPLWAGACQKHRGWKTCYKGKKKARGSMQSDSDRACTVSSSIGMVCATSSRLPPSLLCPSASFAIISATATASASLRFFSFSNLSEEAHVNHVC